MTHYDYMWVASPVGKLQLVAKGDALAAILWENERPNRVLLEPMIENRGSAVLAKVAEQLAEYFAGQRSRFEVKLDFKGTAFQRQVWAALLTIPFGETRTYSQIATQIGRPASMPPNLERHL